MIRKITIGAGIAALTVVIIAWLVLGKEISRVQDFLVLGTLGLAVYLLIDPSFAFANFRNNADSIAKLGPVGLVIVLYFLFSVGAYVLLLLGFPGIVINIALIFSYGILLASWFVMSGIIERNVTQQIENNSITKADLMQRLEILRVREPQAIRISGIIEQLQYSPDDNGAHGATSNVRILEIIESKLLPAARLNDLELIENVMKEISQEILVRNITINSSREKM